ncbi:TetR family transcriptional regulator C-terminal domain-containing protein [Nocardia sp. NPDC003999]
MRIPGLGGHHRQWSPAASSASSFSGSTPKPARRFSGMEHPAHEYFRDRYRTARDALTRAIADLCESCRVPADLDPDRFAVLAMAVLDGLQTQWPYDPADHVAYLWELIERSGTS